MTAELTAKQQRILEFLVERHTLGEPPPTYREICRRFGYSSPKAAADHVAALERKGLVTRERGSSRGVRIVATTPTVPVTGRVPAGTPRDAYSVEDEHLVLDAASYGISDQSKAFVLRVIGDSMSGRNICEGDLVLLERDVDPLNGDIVAALVDNEVTLKTFVRSGHSVWLRAENSKYPLIRPVIDLKIQGVARAVIRLLSS